MVGNNRETQLSANLSAMPKFIEFMSQELRFPSNFEFVEGNLILSKESDPRSTSKTKRNIDERTVSYKVLLD